MPFVGARKCPPGTVVVAEIGLIDIRRDGGRRREVNEFLTQKFVEEKKQKKLDLLEEARRDGRSTELRPRSPPGPLATSPLLSPGEEGEGGACPPWHLKRRGNCQVCGDQNW